MTLPSKCNLDGLVSELSVDAVLVVQVSGHCKNSIKETDAARKNNVLFQKIKDYLSELIIH